MVFNLRLLLLIFAKSSL